MTDKQFTIVREFDAPREAVWRAWTDPTIAAQWWHPHGVTTPADHESVAEPIRRLPKLVVSSTLERAPWGDGEIELLRPEPDAATAVRALEHRYGTVIVRGSLTQRCAPSQPANRFAARVSVWRDRQ